MKLFLKPITLKEDTINEINSGNYDVTNFISSINEYLSKSNDLLYTKIESLNEYELYQKLQPIYNIKITATEKTATGELIAYKIFDNNYNYYLEY